MANQYYIVPMEWTHHGHAVVKADSPEQAKDLAVKGQFDKVELQESAAELVDWDVIGKVRAME